MGNLYWLCPIKNPQTSFRRTKLEDHHCIDCIACIKIMEKNVGLKMSNFRCCTLCMQNTRAVHARKMWFLVSVSSNFSYFGYSCSFCTLPWNSGNNKNIAVHKQRSNLKHIILLWDPVTIIYYAETGSSVKLQTQN